MFILISFTATPAQNYQHLQNTLSQYGKAVVREMRALAAERDLPNQPDDPPAGLPSPAISATDSAAAVSTAGSSDSDKQKQKQKQVATKKKKSKGGKTQQVAHIVDKMLFNYRNIGTF